MAKVQRRRWPTCRSGRGGPGAGTSQLRPADDPRAGQGSRAAIPPPPKNSLPPCAIRRSPSAARGRRADADHAHCGGRLRAIAAGALDSDLLRRWSANWRGFLGPMARVQVARAALAAAATGSLLATLAGICRTRRPQPFLRAVGAGGRTDTASLSGSHGTGARGTGCTRSAADARGYGLRGRPASWNAGRPRARTTQPALHRRYPMPPPPPRRRSGAVCRPDRPRAGARGRRTGDIGTGFHPTACARMCPKPDQQAALRRRLAARGGPACWGKRRY